MPNGGHRVYTGLCSGTHAAILIFFCSSDYEIHNTLKKIAITVILAPRRSTHSWIFRTGACDPNHSPRV